VDGTYLSLVVIGLAKPAFPLALGPVVVKCLDPGSITLEVQAPRAKDGIGAWTAAATFQKFMNLILINIIIVIGGHLTARARGGIAAGIAYIRRHGDVE